MSNALLSVRHLSKSFGGLVATQDVSLDVLEGEVHAIMGPNGAGKSTLIAQISGLLKPDSGAIVLEGRDITRMGPAARSRAGLARVFQVSSIFKDFSAYENMLVAVQRAEPSAFRFWRPVRKDPVLRERAMEMLETVGLGLRADIVAGTLSYGEQRRLELAMAIARKPRVLLLDEPMAGMGPEEAVQITKLLSSLRGHYTMLLVEHDVGAVFELSDRITVMVYGQTIASGTPAEIRADVAVQRAYLGEETAEEAPQYA